MKIMQGKPLDLQPESHLPSCCHSQPLWFSPIDFLVPTAKPMFINIEFHHVDPFLSFQLHPNLEVFIIFYLWHWVSKHVFLQWFQWPLDPRNPENCCGPRQQDPDPEIGQRISTSVASSFHRCHVGQSQNHCAKLRFGDGFYHPWKYWGLCWKLDLSPYMTVN